MTAQRPAPYRRTSRRTAVKNRWLPLAAAFTAISIAVGGLGWRFAGDGNSRSTADRAWAAAPIERAPQTVLGLRVDAPAVDRGRLPLNTAVTQLYEIVNTGTGAAEFGTPAIEVLEGCCPPQVRMTQMVVAAGETATVGFSTQMHEGMDGPHVFHITVPFRSAAGEDALHLYFRGDFRG